MSVKNDILDALQVQLEGIKPSAGYNKKIFLVARHPLSYEEARQKMPFVSIVEDGESVLVEDDTNVRFNLIVVLNTFIYAEKDVPSHGNELIDDIKKLFYNLSASTLSSYCLDIRMTALENFWIIEEQQMGAANIGLEIIYYAPKAGF